MTLRPIGVKTILLAIAGLLAVTLSACGDDDPAVARDEGAALSIDDFDGQVFATAQVAGHRLVDETVIRLGFAGDQLSVEAGCNHMTGAVSLDGGRLRVSNLVSTEIGCEKDRADQDAWIAGFLTSGPTVALDGDTLTLAEGKVSMALAALPAADTPSGDPGDTVTSNNG